MRNLFGVSARARMALKTSLHEMLRRGLLFLCRLPVSSFKARFSSCFGRISDSGLGCKRSLTAWSFYDARLTRKVRTGFESGPMRVRSTMFGGRRSDTTEECAYASEQNNHRQSESPCGERGQIWGAISRRVWFFSAYQARRAALAWLRGADELSTDFGKICNIWKKIDDLGDVVDGVPAVVEVATSKEKAARMSLRTLKKSIYERYSWI